MDQYQQFLQANDVGIIRSRREETAKKLGGDEIKAMNIENTTREFVMRVVF